MRLHTDIKIARNYIGQIRRNRRRNINAGTTEDSVVGLAGSKVVKASLIDCSGTNTEVTGGSFKEEPSKDNPMGVAEVPPVVVAETTAKEVPG